jgi:hypothetical protein
LFTAGAPAGSDPSVGDITYYAPGNLAIFYRDFGYSRGLFKADRFRIEAMSARHAKGDDRARRQLRRRAAMTWSKDEMRRIAAYDANHALSRRASWMPDRRSNPELKEDRW